MSLQTSSASDSLALIPLTHFRGDRGPKPKTQEMLAVTADGIGDWAAQTDQRQPKKKIMF